MERPVRRTVRIAIDVSCLCLVCVPTAVFRFGILEPFQRGFYCNDESLNKPYVESPAVQWHETVIAAVLLVVALIILIELARFYSEPNKDLLQGFSIGHLGINDWVVKTYKYIGMYFFGLALCMSFNDIGTFTIGRLSPHFLAVCLPNQDSWKYVNCSGPAYGTWRYIDDNVCTGDKVKVKEARLSFPSDQSTLAWFAMLYLAIYLQVRMTWKFSRLLRHFLQACLLWMALYASLAQISGFRNHPTDVLAGAVLGILCVIMTIHWVPELFDLPVRLDGDNSANDGRKISTIIHVPGKKISRTSVNSRNNMMNDSGGTGVIELD